ncbi:MAG: glycosyltransferase family 1 protein [Chloroflexi bacterium]|nr:glycosyltransferase family 1 protein [Chloroflexota bacterium]
MTRTITLLASGTRGDVQPYLALGLGLREAGFDIRIATHANFAPLVAPTGLTFARLDDNPSDLFARPGGESALRLDGNLARSLRATMQFWRDAQPLFERLLVSGWRACQGSDALVIGLATLWGVHIAEALRVPCVRGYLQPFTRTRAFPCPLLPFTFSLGAAYNRATYALVHQTIWQSWRGVVNRWRRDTLQLKPAAWSAPFARDDAPTLYAFSDHVVPRPPDWSASQVVTGYWFLPRAREWSPPRDLARFLAAGDPPVYLGFGSLTVRRMRATVAAMLRAVEQAKVRAVVAFPREFLGDELPKTIFLLGDAPHAWLFPRMSALAHHGGAGTTAAGLRAGLPAIVIPLAVDQFFWAQRIADLGVGARSIAYDALTADALADALTRVTRDAEMKSRAREIAHAIEQEDGVARAVAHIRAWV